MSAIAVSSFRAWRFLLVTSLAIALVACTSARSQETTVDGGQTVVFVHGAWGGGWQFTKVQPLLEAEGHTVYRPTMTGLGERVHLAGPDVGLSTHVEDIVKVLEFENLRDVVLVGHSYGGMAIAGVAERVPDRIALMIYFDAILPVSGESVAGLFGSAIDAMAEAGGGDAEPWQLVPRWVEEGKKPPVDVPQPLLTFSESIELSNLEAQRLPAVYLLTVEAGSETDDFDRFAERARARGWRVVTMEGDHNPHWYRPEAFVDVLLAVVED
jgi:pimeloyl-ACP methyl ester carboxylesterase